MANLLLIILAYLIGVGFSAYVFHPMRNWEDGYNTAKERYRDWYRGFDDGFKAGWDSAMEQEGAQE